jgi:hypothetical protein
MSLSFHLSKSLKMRAMAECSERSIHHCAPCGLTLWLWLRRKWRLDELRLLIFSAALWQGFEKSERGPSLAFLLPPQAAVGSAAVQVRWPEITKRTPA